MAEKRIGVSLVPVVRDFAKEEGLVVVHGNTTRLSFFIDSEHLDGKHARFIGAIPSVGIGTRVGTGNASLPADFTLGAVKRDKIE